MSRLWSSDVIAAAEARVRAGDRLEDIHDVLGVPLPTLRMWRVKYGWPRQPNAPIPHDDDVRGEALRRVDDGEAIAAVSRSLGVSRRTIGRWLRLRGTSLKPGDGNAPREWRCGCTPFGTRVVGLICPVCEKPARWAAENR